jgi:hypothetical protein
MSLSNENTGMVDTFSQTALEDLSLEASLQEILNFQGKHVIQSHAALIEYTNTNETTNKGIAFKETFGILGFELQQFTSGTTDFG